MMLSKLNMTFTKEHIDILRFYIDLGFLVTVTHFVSNS